MASAKRLQREAYKAWFAGLLFNTVAGVYTLYQLRQKSQSVDRKEGEGVVESKKLERYVLVVGNEGRSLGTDEMGITESVLLRISNSFRTFAI